MLQSSSKVASTVTHVFAMMLCFSMISAAQAHQEHHNHAHEVIKAMGGDFTLISAHGPVSLSDFKGKVVAIYFGYTHCTDACPIDLGRLGKALKSMKPEEVARIQPLFITLDPLRDDAGHMASYSASFHPKLIGLTGSEKEVSEVAKNYGISYKKGPVNSKGGYDIDHPSDIRLVGPNGQLLQNLPHSYSPLRIAAELQKALRNN